MSYLRIDLEEQGFEPGATVSGRVTWDAGRETPQKLLVSLLWHTEGKGTEDVEVIQQMTMANPGTGGYRDFNFRLPEFPWSFSGQLISLIWTIEASLEPKGEVQRADFVAAPGGIEVRL